MPTNRRPAAKTPKTSMPTFETAVTPVPVLKLWTQEQAAEYLNVSPRYLRDSGCPKVRLPGNGRQRESLLRYKPEQVIQWVGAWSTSPDNGPRAN
jgi:hypothetical protein